MPESVEKSTEYRYPTRFSALEEEVVHAAARIAVVEQQIAAYMRTVDERFRAEEKAVELALTAAEKTTAIAQQTADRAIQKTEASATKEYLEAQILGTREAFDAALIAVRDSLTAALHASDKAILKQEGAIQARFESVNEFRGQLADQARMFLPKSEGDLRFSSVERRLEDVANWRRTIDLKFAEYITGDLYHRTQTEWIAWRRSVEASLTAASSKSGLIYAIMAMAIAAGGLLIAVFNLFNKAPVRLP